MYYQQFDVYTDEYLRDFFFENTAGPALETEFEFMKKNLVSFLDSREIDENIVQEFENNSDVINYFIDFNLLNEGTIDR